MAKLEFETPVKNIRGKISSYERIITRTRNGKTHSYIVHKPYKGPHSEKQTQAFSTFAQAVNRCKQEMNDPGKLAAWQSQYDAYRKNLAKHPAPQGTKTYSTLRGYIIAGLIQLSKSLPLQIMLLLFYALPSWAQQSIPYTYGFENNNLAAPIYYFTLCAQIQAPIQRMYCVNAPAKVKKMALLMSSYSPGVYDGALAEFRDICNYWQVENLGHVTAKIDEQKTEATKQKVIELVKRI